MLQVKGDINNRADIATLISRFYDHVKIDPVVGHIFTDIAKVDWDKHLPVIHDFWENTLLYTGTYTGNPMKIHQQLHRLFPLTENHFAQWNKLFAATVDELFEGEKAVLAKQRAVSISTMMRLKLIHAV